MKKEFTPYEQALDLKELGFDEPCLMFYEQGSRDKYLQKGIDDDYWGDYSEPQKWNSMPNKPYKPFCQCISAPLYQQAFRWFREKHGLYSWVTMELGNKSTFCWVLSGEHTSTQYAAYFHTYEEAELACLIKLIEIVKNER